MNCVLLSVWFDLPIFTCVCACMRACVCVCTCVFACVCGCPSVCVHPSVGAVLLFMFSVSGIQGCQPGLKALPAPSQFSDAVNVDFESWARIMQATGIKYSTLTVKHGCGFTLWPSKVRVHCMAESMAAKRYMFTFGLGARARSGAN